MSRDQLGWIFKIDMEIEALAQLIETLMKNDVDMSCKVFGRQHLIASNSPSSHHSG